MKYLVIGATGLVGRQFGRLLTDKKMSWSGTYGTRPESGLLKLDITNPTEVETAFSAVSPKTVVHAANLAGGVNFSESHPKEAADFHLKATKNIGAQCKRVKAKLVFISTDYVFDGAKELYREDDAPNPLNLYGRLKLESEKWLTENLEDYLIIRTTNIYGWDPTTKTPNYMMGLYRAVTEGQVFNAPLFLFGNPIYALDLAEAILELCAKGAKGVFHITGKNYLNRFDWAKMACEILGLDKSLVKELKAPPPGMVPRPMKSRLDAGKFTNFFETTLHNLDEGLKLMKNEMENGRI